MQRAIEILRTDLVRTLKLLGVPSVAALNRLRLVVPAEWDVAERTGRSATPAAPGLHVFDG